MPRSAEQAGLPALAQHEDEAAIGTIVDRQKTVALLGAEMRNVDARGRVVRNHPQERTVRHPVQPLSGLEHRKGAEQPAGIELFGRVGRIGWGAIHAAHLALRGAGLKGLLSIALAGTAAAQDAVAPPAVVPYTITDAREITESLTGWPGDARRGGALYATVDCSACHDALPGAGLSAGQIRLWIVAPAAIVPETLMPAYYAAGQRKGAGDPLHGGPALTASEIENLVAFLAAALPPH